jgi:hypothetical protein
MNFEDINASASPEVQMNGNFLTIEYSSVYGKRRPVTTGLTWGYYGGRWGGFAVAEGTLALTNTATNYVVVLRSSGAISVSTSSTNWDATSTYARVYKLTTAGGVVTAEEDHRAGASGIHGPSGSGSGSIGRHAVWVSAAAMRPSATGGCAALAVIASAANQPDIATLDFDATTQEFAQFSIAMPKSWNEGTLTYKPVWSHAAAASFTVVWSLQAVAISNDDTIAVAFGTAQSVVDTGGTTNDLYVGPESSAMTVGGSPAAEDVVHFRVARETDDSSQSLNVDGRLHGIILYMTTDAETDA